MDLVELLRTSNQFEAEVIVARLRDAGVQAVVFSADAAGWAPHLALVQGSRVMVPEDALEFSQELIEPV
jgi:hypothetical protein